MSPIQSVSRTALRYIQLTLVCLCMLVLSPLAAWANGGPQRVLILHSYHQGLAWTDNIQSALTATLAQSGLPLDVHVKYLDATRLADPKAFRRNVELLHQQLVDEFAGKPFDLVLVSDNPALDFVLEHREPLTGKAPVVFCGINNFSPDHLRGQPDVTGVAEMPSFDATVDLALKLRPKASKLLVLAEETPTGKANQSLLLAQSARFSSRVEIEVVKETDIYKLEARLAELGPEWIVLPMVRPRDEHGVLSAAEASQRLSRASAVPLIVAWDFWMGHGPALGVVVSAKHQGETAAAMAIRILKGERAESIPVATQGNNVVMADHLALARFGMSEHLLPDGAEMLNAPASFYAVNKGLFWAGGVIGLCLLLLSLSLAGNVSRRKRAEELYRGQLNFVETLLQTIPAPVFYKDVEGRYLGVNPAFEALMGKPAKDFIGRSPEEAFPQEDGQVFAQRDREIQKLGDTQRYEHVMPTALGLRSLTFTKSAFPGNDGSPAGIVGIIMDITEHSAALRALEDMSTALAQSRDLLQLVIDIAPIRVFWKDRECRFLGCNPAFARDAGKNVPSELIGLDDYAMGWAEQADLYRADDLGVMESGQPRLDFEEPQSTPDGKTLWLRTSKVPLRDVAGSVIGVLGVYDDITGRKKAEEALRDSERFLRSTQAIARIGSWRLDLATNQVVWTEELCRMYGLDPALPPPPYTEHMKLFSPASWELLATSFANTRETGIPYELELETVRKDGSNGWMWVRGEAARDTEGNITSIWGAAQDITERKRAEDALRESELRFKTLHNVSFGGITIHEKGRILECNQGLSDISGYSYEELIGMDGLLLIAEQSRELVMANILSGYEKPYEAYGLRKNGEVYPLRLEARNIPYQGRTVRVVEFRDITESRLAQQALEQEARRRRILMEKSLDGIVIIDQEHRVVEANERFSSMLGYSQEEVLGLYTWDYEAVASEADIRADFSDLSTVSRVFETSHRRKDGSLFDVEISLSGTVVAEQPLIFAICRDITERKRAEDELRYANKRLTALWSISALANADFKTICNHILNMIVEMTGSRFGFYGFVNQVESEMTIHTWSGEAMEGCTVLEKPAHFLISHAGVWGEAVRKRRPFILNDYSEAHPAKKGCPSGHVQLENLLVVPFFSAGRIISVAAVANRLLPYTQEDVEQITSFLTGTQAIVERMQALEELTLAKDAAESANRAKSEFLANMSHEIRTPLNGVLGMLQLIQACEVSGDVESYAEMGIRAGQRLTSLLGDILDLSRIEAGRMPIVSKPFALADIFTALAETFSPMHYSKPISLAISASPDLPADVVGDEVRVRQILFNLVGNAMKFTDNGKVRVEVSTLMPLPSGQVRLLFIVRDTGLGIPDEKVSQVCAPFVQAASDFTRSHQGAGLGLSIARKLIDAMGGTLTFESTEGQGTCVYLMLPFGIPENSARPATPESMHDAAVGASLRLLLVEDEEISRMSVRLNLEKLGHQVFTANNGEEAIEALRAGRYDCVLMDIQMDVLDGVAATRAIRSGLSGVLDAQVPIVAMTAYAMEGDRERFLEAGMNDYVAKPLQLEELKKALGRVIGKNSEAVCSQELGDCPGQE